MFATGVLQVCYRCATGMLRVCYMFATGVPQVSYRCATGVLHVRQSSRSRLPEQSRYDNKKDPLNVQPEDGLLSPPAAHTLCAPFLTSALSFLIATYGATRDVFFAFASGTLLLLRRPRFPVGPSRKCTPRDAMLRSLRPVDWLWLALALSFLLAYCAHRGVPRATERLRLYGLLQELIRYGKSREEWRGSGGARLLWEVPKRWFAHFYAVSVLWNGVLLLLVLRLLVLGVPLPPWLDEALRLLAGDAHAPPQAGALSVALVQTLLWVHSARRLFECLFVSVFSDTSINAPQYAFGLAYYVLLGLTVLGLGPLGGATGAAEKRADCRVRWFHGLGLLLFLWASLHQHRCAVLLARLRTRPGGRAGERTALGHAVPRGDWFELVSCPHYLAELLVYVALSACCGGGALTWWLVVLYVLCNQLLAARLSHDFYLSSFEGYPRERAALVPYLL
uniref:Polyprenal reductase n=1 Tax=Scleropages formosus TaxID=113540 RepID=A0A8C9TR72_SCLFO